MRQREFSAAFKGSPMKRAKLRGLKRNAAVVLGNASPGSGQAVLAVDVGVLTRALDDEEPLVRGHAAWAPAQLARREEGSSAREGLDAAASQTGEVA
jgi:epoxyqueuosine reductase